MPFLTRGQLAKFLLGITLHEPLHPGKHFISILAVKQLPLRTTNELFDLEQTRLVQMRTQTILNLLKNLLKEALRVIGFTGRSGDDLVHEAGGHQLLAGDPLAHDERFVGLGDSQALYKGAGGAALGDEAEGGEWGKEEGVRGGVDEVCEGDEGCGETDCWTVECGDKDLGVVVDGAGEIEVVDDEGPSDLSPGVAVQAAAWPGGVHVCSANGTLAVEEQLEKEVQRLRGEVTTSSCQDGDENVVSLLNFP